MPNITNSNVISGAAQLSTGVVESAAILDATIVNADISASAAIALSKISGAAASGANSDITSLSALSTPLSVAQGGTGAATLGDAGVLIGNGTGAIAATGAGTADEVLTSNGAGVDPSFKGLGGPIIASVTADVSVANDNTERTVFAVSVPANTLGTNKGIRARAFFSIDNAGVGGNMTFKAKYGATTFATGTAQTLTSAKGYIDISLFATGATNTQEGSLVVDLWANGVGTALAAFRDAVVGTSAEDSTGALNLTLTATMATAHANNNWTFSHAIITKL